MKVVNPPDVEPIEYVDPLVTMEFWKAPSFWYLLVSTLGTVWMGLDQAVTAMGWDIPDWSFLGQEEAIVNAIMVVVTGATGFMAWFERRDPKKRLTLTTNV